MDERGERVRATARPLGAHWIVLAGPFTRAERLRDFLAAVGRIEGLTELVAESFRLGELALRLRYAGRRPLAECLAILPAFSARVEVAGPRTLRVTLDQASPGD